MVLAGFSTLSRRGKGRHDLWTHPQIETTVLVPQPMSDLLPVYVDKQVQEAIHQSRAEGDIPS